MKPLKAEKNILFYKVCKTILLFVLNKKHIFKGRRNIPKRGGAMIIVETVD